MSQVKSSPRLFLQELSLQRGHTATLGSRKQLILHGTQRQLILSTAYVSLSTSFPNMQFECCKLLQGTLGGHFDIFAASGESIAWDFLWKTRSSPSVVRVCLVAQFNFCSSAFDPRAWTKDVFWKEVRDVSTSLLHLRTKGEQAVAVDWHVRMNVDMLAHVIWIFRIFWSGLFFQLMVVKNQQS